MTDEVKVECMKQDGCRKCLGSEFLLFINSLQREVILRVCSECPPVVEKSVVALC